MACLLRMAYSFPVKCYTSLGGPSILELENAFPGSSVLRERSLKRATYRYYISCTYLL